MAKIGEKRTIILNGRKVPGVVISETSESIVQVPSKNPARNGALVNIPTFRADILSLRETLPDAEGKVTKYLTITNENLRFSPPRFSTVPGLDVDEETGAMMYLEDIIERATESMALFQAQRANATTNTEVEVDLDGLTDEVETQTPAMEGSPA